MPEPRTTDSIDAAAIAEQLVDRLVKGWAARRLPMTPLSDELLKAAVAGLIVEQGAQPVAAMLQGLGAEIAALNVPLSITPPAGRA